MKKLLIASLLSGLTMVGSLAHAETTTSNFQATAQINSSCVITGQNVNFGNINFINDTYYSENFNISVLCNKGVSYSLAPQGFTESFTGEMTGATAGNTDTLTYGLWNPVDDKAWFNSTGYTIEAVSNGSLVSHLLRADLAPSAGFNSVARPDTYSGTVTAIITY